MNQWRERIQKEIDKRLTGDMREIQKHMDLVAEVEEELEHSWGEIVNRAIENAYEKLESVRLTDVKVGSVYRVKHLSYLKGNVRGKKVNITSTNPLQGEVLEGRMKGSVIRIEHTWLLPI